MFPGLIMDLMKACALAATCYQSEVILIYMTYKCQYSVGTTSRNDHWKMHWLAWSCACRYPTIQNILAYTHYVTLLGQGSLGACQPRCATQITIKINSSTASFLNAILFVTFNVDLVNPKRIFINQIDKCLHSLTDCDLNALLINCVYSINDVFTWSITD